jgi:hypothetical protein
MISILSKADGLLIRPPLCAGGQGWRPRYRDPAGRAAGLVRPSFRDKKTLDG